MSRCSDEGTDATAPMLLFAAMMPCASLRRAENRRLLAVQEAGDLVPRHLAQRRLALAADRHAVRTARVEAAAFGRVDRARQIALEHAEVGHALRRRVGRRDR